MRYVLIAVLSACITLGAKVASDRLTMEHDQAISSVEINNLKAQLKENKNDLEKRLDNLDTKFERLREDVLRTRLQDTEQIGRKRPVN